MCVLNWLLRGADVNANMYGSSALHNAVRSDSDSTINLLVEAGANVAMVDPDGDTPLCYAVSLAAAKRLIEAGANPDDEHWVYGSVRRYLLGKDPAFARILG